MSRIRSRLRDPNRRGVIIVLGIFGLMLFCCFAAFAVDMGLLMLTQSQLQNAADASALAAVLELREKIGDDGSTVTPQTRAVDVAKNIAELNLAAKRPVKLVNADIRLGQRVFTNGNWTTTWYPATTTESVNAVSVRAAFDENSGDMRRMRLLFARAPWFMGDAGRDDAAVAGEGVAFIFPKDLVLCLDTSESMKNDNLRNSLTDAINIRGDLFGFMPDADSEIQGQYGVPEFTGQLDVDNPPDGNLDSKYKILWVKSRDDGVWGDATQRDEFRDQEFMDAPTGPNNEVMYWEHPKWKLFVESCESTNPFWYRDLPPNALYNKPAGALDPSTRSPLHPQYSMNLTRYLTFLIDQQLVPAYAGQQFYLRDTDLDGNLETFPPNDSLIDSYPGTYPSHSVYYPRPKPDPDFQISRLYDGNGDFSGEYDGSVNIQPLIFVRKPALFGIYSLISDEVSSSGFNRIGLITYGTLAHRDLELTSSLEDALTVATQQITWAHGENVNYTFGYSPAWNGFTNIGMALRQGVEMLTDYQNDPNTREVSRKAIILLTDGNPKISPAGGDTASEFLPSNSYDLDVNFTNSTLAEDYTKYWAGRAHDNDVVIHAIGLGTGVNEALLEDIADKTGGFYFLVTDPENEQDRLQQIFIGLAQDRVGRLFKE